MDVYELVEKVNGEIVGGRARVRRGNTYVQLGRVTPEGMVMTEAGRVLVDSLNAPKKNVKKPAASKKPAATGKATPPKPGLTDGDS